LKFEGFAAVFFCFLLSNKHTMHVLVVVILVSMLILL
jgi:hypothetical protein